MACHQPKSGPPAPPCPGSTSPGSKVIASAAGCPSTFQKHHRLFLSNAASLATSPLFMSDSLGIIILVHGSLCNAMAVWQLWSQSKCSQASKSIRCLRMFVPQGNKKHVSQLPTPGIHHPMVQNVYANPNANQRCLHKRLKSMMKLPCLQWILHRFLQNLCV